MKRTFTRTTFKTNEELQKATVRVFITKGLKWEEIDGKEVKYVGLKSWSIVDGEDAKEIENEIIESGYDIDENHEYLVLEFTDGTTATFRNSHTDLFLA